VRQARGAPALDQRLLPPWIPLSSASCPASVVPAFEREFSGPEMILALAPEEPLQDTNMLKIRIAATRERLCLRIHARRSLLQPAGSFGTPNCGNHAKQAPMEAVVIRVRSGNQTKTPFV